MCSLEVRLSCDVVQRTPQYNATVTRRSDLHERPSVAGPTVATDLGVRVHMRIVTDRVVQGRVDSGARVPAVSVNTASLVEILVDAEASVVDLLEHPDAVSQVVFGLESLDPFADAATDRP